MWPIFVECPPSDGGALLLVGTKVVGSWAFGESFWFGEDFDILILYIIYVIIDVIIAMRYYMSLFIFSSEYFLLD